MKEYPNLNRDYITYNEFRSDPNDTGVYEGHYIRKDVIIRKTLPWYVIPTRVQFPGGAVLRGFAVPGAIDPTTERIALATYWDWPIETIEKANMRLVLKTSTGKNLIDTTVNAGYHWYTPDQWIDTGLICRYIFVPCTIDSGQESVRLSFLSEGDNEIAAFDISTRRDDYEAIINRIAQTSLDFDQDIPVRLAETGRLLHMLQPRFWDLETGQKLISDYMDKYLGEYDEPENSHDADSMLAIFKVIRALDPAHEKVMEYGESLNRYYYRIARERLDNGWRHYPQAFDEYLKALQASASFPEVRKGLEAIRPWVVYLHQNPEILVEYPNLIPIDEWLSIYREFLRGSKIRQNPFHSLFVNHLVDKKQIQAEFENLSTMDRMQLYQLELTSADLDRCYAAGQPLATYGEGALILADCRLTMIGEGECLFEAVFIPDKRLNKNYAIDGVFFASSNDLLPEAYRERGHQQISFGTIPALISLPDKQPSYTWRKLDLDFTPVNFSVGLYVPGGPPWYPLMIDNPDQKVFNCSQDQKKASRIKKPGPN
jgi:hypothetical protein